MNSTIGSKHLIDKNEDVNLLTLFYLLWKDKFKILGFAIPISLIVFFSFNFLNSQYQFSKTFHENKSNMIGLLNNIQTYNSYESDFLDLLFDKEFVYSAIKENSFDEFQLSLDDFEEIISSYKIKEAESLTGTKYFQLSFKSIHNKFPESVFYDLLDHANNKSISKIKKAIKDEIFYTNQLINNKIELEIKLIESEINKTNVNIKKELKIHEFERQNIDNYLKSNLNIAKKLEWYEPYPNLPLIDSIDDNYSQIPKYFFGTRIINQEIDQNKNNLSSPVVEKMNIEIFHLNSKLENINLYVDTASELMKLKSLSSLEDIIANKKLFYVHDELTIKFLGLSMIIKITISIIIGLFVSFFYTAMRKVYSARLTRLDS